MLENVVQTSTGALHRLPKRIDQWVVSLRQSMVFSAGEVLLETVQKPFLRLAFETMEGAQNSLICRRQAWVHA
jgi:hypothetical protein